MSYDNRHFKLTNGEEIICQVVEWNDDQTPDIIVRNAMRIYSVQSPDGTFYHSFKPWMLFIDQPDMFITLNHMQVIGEAIPHSTVLEQYQNSLEYQWANNSDINRVEDPSEKLRKILDDMGAVNIEDLLGDSDSEKLSNILKFDPSKNKKLH